MSRFGALLDVKMKANREVREYLASCRKFAFELLDGFSRYLDCPRDYISWRLNIDSSSFMPIRSIHSEMIPDENGNWDLWIRIWFGVGNGAASIRLTFRRFDGYYEIDHEERSNIRISDGNLQVDTESLYEFLYGETVDFFENILERSHGAKKQRIGFELSGPAGGPEP